MKYLIIALLLPACVDSRIIQVNKAVNATPYSAHKSVTDDWQGLANFHGGNCYQKSQAKCALLYGQHTCKVVLGTTPKGGHAVALVDGKYWLDNRTDVIGKPSDFVEVR